jgi:signal transduction histidine kinase
MELNNKQLIESVFTGNSEMAALMRAFDWSTTPLGPVEQWPQALRICAQIVLHSGYPMSICWGPRHVMLYNDAYRPPMGAKHPWALGHSCHEVFPETWGFMGPLHERILTQGQETSFLTSQLVSLNRNNYLEECYFAFSYGPIPDDYGHVGGVLGTGLETTERVLEDRRRQVLRDLALRTVGARNEEEVWRVSAETLGEHRLSIPFAFLYEYRPAERQAYLTGTSVETDETLHPAVIRCDGENLWRLDPALTRDGVVIELGNRAAGLSVPNWPERPKEACVVPIRLGEHSEALGFLVLGIHPGRAFDDAYRQFVHRISEQITIGLGSARAYEHERQRADALAELDRAKTAFFSNVSHEFRTPLTLMLGPLEEVLPEASERLRPEHHEQLVAVRRNGLRLLKLVNTLLDFSRIESGRMQASYQPTDLASFTSEIASAFDSAMDNAGLRFSVECQPITEAVYVDRDMWEKVVLNLLSNALKFTFQGEVALTLKFVDRVVELQVRDTGVGIPEENRERVFERFHRIEGTQARTYEGTGIGLALVQELVKLHGGSVRVESAAGQGSTFTVRIPSGKEHLPAERIQAAPSFASTRIRGEAYVEEAQEWLGDEPAVAVNVETTSSAEPKAGAKRELILLADDNADMRQYLIRVLSDRYEVHAARDGREALEAARQLRPALVLSDVMMPHVDGFGLLRAIREDAALAGTPVILLSARAGEESRVEGLQADADDYLIKPFAARELLARVATHVKMANYRREAAEREERLRGEAELEREKLRARDALEEARTDLAHAARVMSLGSLAASIAHELNQPLSGIVTNAGTCQRMLAATPPNVEGALETARRTIRDATRASDVIKGLRALFSRGIATSEPVDLNEATEEVIALLMGELQRNQSVVRSEFAEDLPLVMGDRVQLQQVVLNLLRNGSEAMTAVDDRPRHLVIRTEQDEGQRVRLSVKDAGVGFEPQGGERLFESFYTTKKDGMGIGLSISKSIIEGHNGRLWAERNEGPGATFSFSIPCAAEKSLGQAAGESGR